MAATAFSPVMATNDVRPVRTTVSRLCSCGQYSEELGREKSATKLGITVTLDPAVDVGSLISGLNDAPPRANFFFSGIFYLIFW
jgi:hypothetical protein